jgi:hypothetical protein
MYSIYVYLPSRMCRETHNRGLETQVPYPDCLVLRNRHVKVKENETVCMCVCLCVYVCVRVCEQQVE